MSDECSKQSNSKDSWRAKEGLEGSRELGTVCCRQQAENLYRGSRSQVKAREDEDLDEEADVKSWKVTETAIGKINVQTKSELRSQSSRR